MKFPTVAACLVTVALAACYTVAPVPVAPRSGTAIAASFGRAWDATIDEFAEHGISIASVDRVAGLIVPAGHKIASGSETSDAEYYADCGATELRKLHPETVRYNVIVHGDSSSAHVLVRAFYEPYKSESDIFGRCISRGYYESILEDSIKARAERPR
jgi:hypothetical protein